MSILINVKISQVDLQKDVKEHKKLLGKWNKQPECGIADATMNDHAMDARMTETLNWLMWDTGTPFRNRRLSKEEWPRQ